MPKNYRLTTVACCMGNFSQAIVVNFLPLIFLALREQFGLSFERLGLLVTINFITQVVTDLSLGRAAERLGVRSFVVLGLGLCASGMALLGLVGLTLDNAYPGLVAATVVYSCGGGLMELLLSPIVDAIPTDEKATAMSLLHSFYAWGQVVVVLLTTLGIYLFSSASWPFIAFFWAVFPVINATLFLKAPIAPPVPEETRMPVKSLMRSTAFLTGLGVIVLAGMSELCMSQWASAFMEKALGLSKLVGDIAGMCMFGVCLGIGRMLYGVFGARIDIRRMMIAGSALAVVCYLTVALVDFPPVSLAACALTGFAVSLLWPGSLVLQSRRFPLAGVSMFALMAAGGDVGAAVGPYAVGAVADHAPALLPSLQSALGGSPEAFGLHAGLLAASVFPLLALVGLLMLRPAKTA